MKLHVQRLGSGAPVVMVHGLLVGSLASWYFTAAPALARGRHVLLYDLRGHGMSERVPAGYDVATMTRDLAALTADIREPMALVGHSFGGLVALRFAIDHPERVSRLVVVEAPLPPSRFGELGQLGRRTPPEPIDLIDALPAPMRAFVMRGSRQARRLLDSLRFLALESTLVSDLEAEPDIADAELARISCPTLCVYGSESSCRGVGDRLALAIAEARLVVLPGGHYLHVDAAAALTACIAEFLEA